MQIAIGIVLIIAAVFLIVAVLMQSSKNHNLSGTIAGGAETFFGKTKGTTLDKKLSKLTAVVAIIFCVLVLLSYLLQDTTNYSELFGGNLVTTETTGETLDPSALLEQESNDVTVDETTAENVDEAVVETTDTTGVETASDSAAG